MDHEYARRSGYITLTMEPFVRAPARESMERAGFMREGE